MEPSTALLPAAHRVIRTVDVSESAIAGVLVSDGDGVRVRVDAGGVPAELWRHGDAEHIAGVRDIIRRADGHDALVPWCAERVSALLGRREAAESRLTPGEAVTLVGSLLRGIGEAGAASLTGVWWLADDARPLFVPGDGEPILMASRSVIRQVRALIADRGLERLLGELENMPDDPRAVQPRLAAWEHGLTEHAAPRALQREAFPPARVMAIPLHRARVATPLDDLTGPAPEAPGVFRGWGARLATVQRAVSARVGRMRGKLVPARVHAPARDGASRAVTPAGDDGRSRAPRRRLALVAVTAVVAVLAVGLFWPEDPETAQAEALIPTTAVADPSEPDTTESGEAEDTGSAGAPTEDDSDGTDAPMPKPPPETPSAPGDAEDAVAAAGQLLAAITGCREAGDAACATAIAPDSAQRVLDGLGEFGADATVRPVEDYGDIAVVRVEAADRRQMLVLIRQNDSWLVRDVYDVADQP